MTKQLFDEKLAEDEYFLNLSRSRMTDLFKLQERMSLIIELFDCVDRFTELISSDESFSE
jgi:hypothetical protein